MSLLPRWVHRCYAFLAGCFWSSCPLCDRYFGGHEWRDIEDKSSWIPAKGQPGYGMGICPGCTRAGRGKSPDWTTAARRKLAS